MQHEFRKPRRMDVAPASPVQPAKTVAAPPQKTIEHNTNFLKRRWKILVVVVAVMLVAGLGYAYITTRNELSRLSDPSAAAEADAKKLASDLGRFLELPQDETPTIATVSDAALLKEQAFFSRAENGDRVLIYSKAQRAALYRPSTKRIIEYAPVSLDTQP